jgi:hypothetical protein
MFEAVPHRSAPAYQGVHDSQGPAHGTIAGSTGLIRPAVHTIALIFCLFPYTQIINLESYTQPYALIFSAISIFVSYTPLVRHFPKRDAAILFVLAAMGFAAFLISCLPNPSGQELKYLLIYVSPLIFALSSFAMVRDYPVLADRVIVSSAVIWIAVGLIQVFVAPSFATQLVGTFGEAAGDVVDSGRGVLGLAPEPTHFGFHMVVMAAALALVGGRNVLSIACLLTAVVIARSSSAILALGIGSIIYLLFFTKYARFLLLLVFPLYALVEIFLNSGILPADVRAVWLLKTFFEDPWYLITADASANARLGGIYVGAKEILGNAFMPFGMSHAVWTRSLGSILAHNSWLSFLSGSGIPSGILIIIYQCGIFGLLVTVAMVRRLLSAAHSHYETLLLASVVIVFFSQYLISTPGFGLIYGIVLVRAQRLGRAQRNPHRQAGWATTTGSALSIPN